MDGQDGSGRTCIRQERDFHLLADCQKAIEYHEKQFKMAIETGDRHGEGGAYENLGIANQLLGDCQKAVDYHEKHLKIAKEIGDRVGKEKPMKISVLLTDHWVTIEKALSTMKNI